MGGYFHQDFSHECSSHREAIDDYLQGMPDEDLHRALLEIPELLAMAGSDKDLTRAVRALGMGVRPPNGVSLRQWLLDVAHIIRRHLGGRPVGDGDR
ncbi:hypothetical protein TPA0910_59730 [Streptomyces hygroscopicus subsp. sporocinereus]|uniref:CdiI immunity protein domain-containing protein n=1 Tax=Streptomyces hygroscopicus TaxID=1912 RepID=A0ABQ3U7G1_STRHY|nr:hypothetical protein TPA0910_59730 [Streptomyces hygroscopicus]